ncbi:hypothetical protein AM493_19950 [Flavobacterium akiainvivens]|uniref:Transcriptional regulator n=1 Tax=Flavobacterium akiainvivens TaxID=1202724 RepID=A0A0M8ML65_9FLAO|nr:hypothetical protein [Flavobacterium akiainvivens]KOS08067.1 hypothetical protein AM493_19950 [Flavobacterium akiainvivens]SFQ62503.1 hypothetical protein SAMN05444144_110135 [Flavobacterium akiainvivens]
MKPTDKLFEFWEAITKDPRITMRHIGLYAALLCVRQKMGWVNPLCLYSYQVMEAAKLMTQCSYHQYIKQLDEFGYIRYEPSFKKNQPSKIFFLQVNK